MSHYSGYNRNTTLSFLYYYSDLHEIGGSTGTGGKAGSGGESGPYASDPLAGYIGRRVDDAHQRATYEALIDAVAQLKTLHWNLWMRIEVLYFRDDNNPSLLDAWRVEAENGSMPDRYALADHDDAVEFVLRRATEKIRSAGYERLKLDLPERIRGERARKNAQRRSEAVDALLEEMAVHGPTSAAAVREAARRTGYTPKQIRVLRREIHGTNRPSRDSERRYA